jgi:acyl-CoA synthetase (NDP forming)
MGTVDVSGGVKILEENGVPHFPFPEASARSLATMHEYWEWLARPRTEVKSFAVDLEKAKQIIEKARKDKRRFLPEVEALELLGVYGFPLPKYRLARGKDEAVEVARDIGYPVALKVASPDVVHKIDIGGVKLGLENSRDVRRAYTEIVSAVERTRPDAEIWGVNVQEMVTGGKETIIGMKRDPKFGPLIMFGLGGIYVEAYEDVTFRLAPIRELSAIHMIESIKAAKTLSGFRGEPPSDKEVLADCLLRLSQLATDLPEIQELDVNPLKVFEKGKGAKAVDARIALSS